MAPIVAEALRTSRVIGQADLAARSAEAGVRQSRARLLPSVSLESRYTEQGGLYNLGDLVNPAYQALNALLGDTRFPTDLDVRLPLAHDSRLRLVQPIFDASLLAGHAVSRNSRDAAHASLRAATRRVIADAQAAYLAAAAARSVERTWQGTLILATEAERVAQRLVDAGRATPDAVLRARADRAGAQQQLAEAQEREQAAARRLNQRLGRPFDAPVEEMPDSAFQFELTVTGEAAEASALARREELQESAAGIRAAEAGVRLATASLLPSVAVALDYGFQGRTIDFSGDTDYWMATVSLSWNLFNGGRDLARRAGAQAEAERLRLRRAEQMDAIRLEVRQAYEAAVVARDAIATATARLEAARKAHDLVWRRYEEGLASQIELLDARTSFTNARLNRVLTIYRYAMRYVDLERAAALRELDPSRRHTP